MSKPSKLDKYDARVPALAAEAVKAAQQSALRAGHSVLVVEDGRLVRKLPNGKRQRLEWIGRKVQVSRVEDVTVRWLISFPE